jgi:hypothetical protein
LPASNLFCTLAISQFWRHGQPKLHDQLPAVSVLAPGQKWKKGFFSIGLTANEEIKP